MPDERVEILTRAAIEHQIWDDGDDVTYVPLRIRSRGDLDAAPSREAVRAFAAAQSEATSEDRVRFRGFPLCIAPTSKADPDSPHHHPAVCRACAKRWDCPGPDPVETLRVGAAGLRPDAPGPGILVGELRATGPASARRFSVEHCPYRRGDRRLPADIFLLFVRDGQRLERWTLPTEFGTAFDAARILGGLRITMDRLLPLHDACRDCPRLSRCGGYWDRADARPLPAVGADENALTIGLTRQGVDHISLRDLLASGPSFPPGTRTARLRGVLAYAPDTDRALDQLGARIPDLEAVEVVEPLPAVSLGEVPGRGAEAVLPPGEVVALFARRGWRPARYRQTVLGHLPAWTVRFERGGEGPALVGASLQLTELCVANCAMCNIVGHHKRPMMPYAEVMETLFEMAASGIRTLDLFGGEITLRRDLFAIIRRTRDLGLTPMFITTGHYLTPSYVRDLGDAGLNNTDVSVDAVTPHLHDEIRQSPGLHARALRALRALTTQDVVDASVSTVILPENLDELVPLIEQTGRLGLPRHFFFFCVNDSPVTSTAPRHLSRPDARRFVDEILPAMEAAGARNGVSVHLKPELRNSGAPREQWADNLARGIHNLKFQGNDTRCQSPGTHVFISVVRGVYPCVSPSNLAPEFIVGSLEGGRTLLDVLADRPFATFLEDAGHHRCCPQCTDPETEEAPEDSPL